MVANDEQKEIWTDGLGNTLWRYGDGYHITTVMTVTPLKREHVEALLDALYREFEVAKD